LPASRRAANLGWTPTGFAAKTRAQLRKKSSTILNRQIAVKAARILERELPAIDHHPGELAITDLRILQGEIADRGSLVRRPASLAILIHGTSARVDNDILKEAAAYFAKE
jgi:hypothetical protein